MTTDKVTLQELQDIANKLRVSSIRATTKCNSGHPTSCASAAEIMSVLFFNTMKYKVSKPRDPSSDRFVLSKGHAAPVLYAAWAEAGLFTHDEFINNLRMINSDLEGHPTPRLSFVDVGTGSLGQGLSVAAGMAYTGKYLEKASYRVFCLLGDGESAEGSVWEALNFASIYKLDNLVAIFDVNRLGQSEATPFQHQMDVYQKRLEAFGWNTYVVDGHDIPALLKSLGDAEKVKGKPTCIIAKTFKGKGMIGVEDKDDWHGKPVGDKTEAVIQNILNTIQNKGPNKLTIKAPVDDAPPISPKKIELSSPPSYKIGEKISTRFVYGTALVKIGTNCSRVIALDGDTKNSTYSLTFKKAFPDRFIECYIAEQNLVGVGIGAGTRNRTIPFVSTFAAFFTRSFDQLRMGAISQANIKCVGSLCGVSIGEDGPSQMALEDIAMFRSIPNATVLYPSDAVSAERAVELAANLPGIVFIRTSRPNTPVLYDNSENFQIGKSKILRQSTQDKVLVIGAGVTINESLEAADQLAKEGIMVRVLDMFSIKPVDKAAIAEHAKQSGGRVVTVEDHYPEGGVGDAVLGALADQPGVTVTKLAVTGIPRSGPSDALLEMFGINHKAIVKAVHDLLR